MNTQLKYIYLVLLFFGLVQVTNGQSKHEVLTNFIALNTHYSELENYEMTFALDYLHADGALFFKQDGNVVHTNKLHYFKMGGNTMLVKDQQLIMLNEQQKTMTYGEYKTGQADKNTNQNGLTIEAMLDSLWNSQAHLSYHVITSNEKLFRVMIEDSKNEFYEAYELTIDKQDNRLLTFVYYLKNPSEEDEIHQIRIRYLTETSKPKLNQAKLKFNYYVVNQKGEKHTSERFSAYTLTDQTKTDLSYE